jgi:hypothetical protein
MSISVNGVAESTAKIADSHVMGTTSPEQLVKASINPPSEMLQSSVAFV